MHGGRYYVAILVILLVAYLLSLDKCPFSCFSGSDTQVEFAVAKLQKQANFGKSPALKRVAVGYNTNLDLACSGVSLLNKLGVDPHSLHNIQPYETIGSKEEFASSFGYFFQQGSAAERAASNMDLWNEILEPLQANNYKDCQVLPGGNAALISNRLAALNISVLLGGPVGKGLEPLINENIKTLKFYREERGAEQLSPVLDEVHLIMEFRTGEKWGPITSPRANRFIISHDLQNSHLTAIEEFHEAIEKFQPEVVIVAGSHLLEILPEAARAARMRTLVDALSNIPSHIAIHLEIAGVGDIEYLEEMARKLLPLVDSIGLNEQELGALYIATGGNQFSLDEFISPSVTVSSGALQHLIKLPYVEQGNGKHELNRIHLHYLSYHMIGQRISPRPGFFTWSKDNAARAVAAGSLATSTQACGTDGKLPDVSELHINSYATDLFSHFKTSSLEFWVAPVAVCNVPKRTVGLGDCISASGIAYHF